MVRRSCLRGNSTLVLRKLRPPSDGQNPGARVIARGCWYVRTLPKKPQPPTHSCGASSAAPGVRSEAVSSLLRCIASLCAPLPDIYVRAVGWLRCACGCFLLCADAVCHVQDQRLQAGTLPPTVDRQTGARTYLYCSCVKGIAPAREGQHFSLTFARAGEFAAVS